jgi:dynein heavy chain, axonemal
LTLDERHYLIFQIIADRLSLEKTDVEDAVLDKNQLQLIDHFFAINGSTSLICHYEEPKETRFTKTAKTCLNIIDNTDVSLNGITLYFVRNSSEIEITTDNMSQEVNFSYYDCQTESILKAVNKQFSILFVPILNSLSDTNWGKLSGKNGRLDKIDFLGKLSNFVTILNGAQDSLDDQFYLVKCESYDLTSIQIPTDFLSVCNNHEAFDAIEGIVRIWMKQIEQILTESDQIRSEFNDIGPRHELEFWKKRTSKFNYLIDQLKTHEVKAALGVLLAAKSRIIYKWRELDKRITDCVNEAKDNVKYLYTLDKFTDPLYNCDPVLMLNYIPGLVNAIKMIHSISRYYNTSERMASLFFKVTNQMIIACRAYVTCKGTHTIWSQSEQEVIKKLDDCIKLNHEYQKIYQNTKQQLAEDPNSRQFNFSEMYIFGKFDNFTKRCQKIIDIFNSINSYSSLHDSNIEGLESLTGRLCDTEELIKSGSYDYLDTLNVDFDQDYDQFKRSLNELHLCLVTFFDSQFERIFNTYRALTMIKRIEKLKLPNIDTREKYDQIIDHYAKDIEIVGKIFIKSRQDPPIARDLPPMSGRIVWARQLYNRLAQPMDIFSQNNSIMHHTDAGSIIRAYNKVCHRLVEYELIHHKSWLSQIENAIQGIHDTVLAINPETNEYFVNFDYNILMIIRETECMKKYELETPTDCECLIVRQEEFKRHYDKLKFLLKKNAILRSKISQPYENLLNYRLNSIDQVLKPGLTNITWVSPNLEEFINEVSRSLDFFELILNRASDLVTYRIEAVFNDMKNTTLCEVNENEPIHIEEFLLKTQELCEDGAAQLALKSKNIEDAAQDLVEVLYPYEILIEVENNPNEENSEEPQAQDEHQKRAESIYSQKLTVTQLKQKRRREQITQFNELSRDLLAFFNLKNLDTLVKLIKTTLEKLQNRLGAWDRKNYAISRPAGIRPTFKCYSVLDKPNIQVKPTLDEIQKTLNKAVQHIVGVSKSVFQWEQEKRSKPILEGTQSMLKNQISEAHESDNEIIEKDHANKLFKYAESDEASSEDETQNYQNSYFKAVSDNKEIVKIINILLTSIIQSENDVFNKLDIFKKYDYIWLTSCDENIKQFLSKEVISVLDFENKIKDFENLIDEVNMLPSSISIDAIALITDKLKLTLTNEIKVWKQAYGEACSNLYKNNEVDFKY